MEPEFENLTDLNREDLSECNQIEEMLLSPVIPIFTVYQYSQSSGFVANSITIVNQIPQTIASLPLMFVKRGDQVIDKTTKFAKVRALFLTKRSCNTTHIRYRRQRGSD
jgi:hypothetical protein